MQTKKWRTVTEADVDALHRDINSILGVSAKHVARGLAALKRRDELLAQGRTEEAAQFLLAEITGMELAMTSLAAGVEVAAWKVLGERRRRGERASAYVSRLGGITGDVEKQRETMARNRIRVADGEGA